MFFNRRKKYNGDVAVLLPAFGFDVEEAGVMKVLGILDQAWADNYNIYEAALTLAYGFAIGLYERDVGRADTFTESRLWPVQADWARKGLVRSEIFSMFTAKLEEIAAAATHMPEEAATSSDWETDLRVLTDRIGSTLFGYVSQVGTQALFDPRNSVVLYRNNNVAVIGMPVANCPFASEVVCHISVSDIPGIEDTQKLMGDGSNPFAVELAIGPMATMIAASMMTMITMKSMSEDEDED